MTARRWSVLVVVFALSMSVAWPAIAHAAAAPTKIVMQTPNALPVQKSDPQSVMVLGAMLSTADGKPVANQKVEFLMVTDILGKTQASVGTVVSDSGGSARTTFVVRKTGPYQFTAKFAGNDAFGPSESPVLKADFEALPSKVQTQLVDLRQVGGMLPWAALALGLAIWAVLIVVLVRVAVVVPRAARGAGPRGA